MLLCCQEKANLAKSKSVNGSIGIGKQLKKTLTLNSWDILKNINYI